MLAQFRAAIEQRNANATFGVWPENWHAFAVFGAMDTQWRVVSGMQGLIWQGLDYAALPVVQAAVRPRIPKAMRRPPCELLPQLRTLESASRAVLNKR